VEHTSTRWLSLEDQPRAVYEYSPLVLTLCQIRFNQILSIWNPVEVGRFQQAIIDDFPIMVSNQGLQFEFEAGAKGSSMKSNQVQESWRFADVEDNWAVTLAPDFITLETRTYNDFEDFVQRLTKLVAALMYVFKPSIILRIGLRYMNEIRSSAWVNGDWRATIHPVLLGPVGTEIFSGGSVQSLNQINFVSEDSRGLNLQYGLLPAGTIVTPKQGSEPGSDAFFYLDIDVFQEFAPRTMLLGHASIDAKVQDFHGDIWRIFRWAVTPEYVSSLKER
jgi:uncharacterized protein (TIGR04255 family)